MPATWLSAASSRDNAEIHEDVGPEAGVVKHCVFRYFRVVKRRKYPTQNFFSLSIV